MKTRIIARAIKAPRSILGVLVLLAFCSAAFAGSVTGKISGPSTGLPIANGNLTFTLSQPAVQSGTSVIVPSVLNCWTDSVGNVVGLPGSKAVQSPVLSSNLASGTLPGATYFVRFTWFNATGESEASPESQLLLGSTGTLIVSNPISVPPLATRLNIYISTSAGTETLQGFVAVTNGVIGAAYQQSSPLVAGAALPSSNTSVCQPIFNDTLIPSFTSYKVNLTNVSNSQIAGYPQKWYLSGGASGTINVSVGTPLFSGIVVYPQAIVTTPAAGATQTINGGLIVAGPFTPGSMDVAAPIYVDRQTGTDICAKIVAAMNANPGGGWLQLPAGTFTCPNILTVPNDGQTPPHQASYKISGTASGGVIQFFPDNGCNGGTILNMTANVATGKIDTRGLGKLEIENICFEDTSPDFTPWIFDTLTVIHVHNNQFYGNTSHFPAGCCQSTPPTQAGQPGIVLGGNGTSSGTGAATDFFQGYGTRIENNQFDYCGEAILLQNQTNSVNIESNHFFNHCTNPTDGPITLNPSQRAQGVIISNNLIEVGGSKYGIHMVQNTIGAYITNNQCWDSLPSGGGISTDCIKEEPSAGNTTNLIIAASQDDNISPFPDSITGLSARTQNGRFLGAVGLTGAGDCTKPIFGASNGDNAGAATINGGGWLICNSGGISHIFNNNAGGDLTTGTGGGYGWEATANPVVASGNPQTQISQPGAGIVSLDTTSKGNAAAKLRLTQIQSASGTATMGITQKRGSGSGTYSTTSTTYVQVDGTNLINTVTIPTGWKLFINVTGSIGSPAGASATYASAITDGGTVLAETFSVPPGAGTFNNMAVSATITGDGASHTIDLRFKTGNAADAANIGNATLTSSPTMTFILMPSN